MAILNKTSNILSPTDFMRARRPELYSDTVLTEEPRIDRGQFEFHLDTLTQRKEEIRFEHFCRRLSEKELCPNLLPQTGPTGGGDSKVDAETFPVADAIAECWYEGDPRAARERWAFAFSAKKVWRPKVKDDIRKIVETERDYSLIYFITNQAVRDRDRAAVEDELHRQWGVEVRILDRSWIVDKVVQNRRWDVVYQTLDIERPHVEPKFRPGPLDTERLRAMEELDRLIEDPARYPGSEYQLAEDSLQTALLARGLGRPRIEIDGRFDRAERIARKRDHTQQLSQILYQRAWTAICWFDDFSEFDRLYKATAHYVLDSESVWDLEKLLNLWQVGITWEKVKPDLYDAASWDVRTTKLRKALQRHVTNSTKPTSALWARTQLVLMDITDSASPQKSLSSVLTSIRGILKEAEGHLDYPVDIVVRIIQELGRIAVENETYDDLIEEVIQLQDNRIGKAKQGQIRLKRGIQKLEAGKTYDSIEQFAMAQNLLAQDEHKDEFVQALVGAALGYEKAGLLWAARANLTVALDRALYEYYKKDQFAPQAPFLLRKLIWVELQLGRIPCVLVWIEWLEITRHALKLDEADRQQLEEEYQLIDAVFGILVLRTRYADWYKLDRVAEVLERFSLLLSRSATLFSLGYEDACRSEYGQTDSDLDQFFSLLLKQPAASDLPAEAEWHLGRTVTMRTVIMGCEVELVAENCTASILLGESILAFLESFLSTAIRLKDINPTRAYLRIEVRQSEFADTPFSHRVKEDECGETSIIVGHPKTSSILPMQGASYEEALFRLLANFISQLQIPFSPKTLEKLFVGERAQDRAFGAAQSLLSLNNTLGKNPKYHIEDWVDASLTESFALRRAKPWKATTEPSAPKNETKAAPLVFSEEPAPAGLFGIDGLKHRDLQILSPINMPLWNKAFWRGLGFAILPGVPIPRLILMVPQ